MPVDTSAIHPIIQAFLQARQLAQQEEQAQLNREHEAEQQDKRLKVQEKLHKMDMDAKQAEFDALMRRTNYLEMKRQLTTGETALQGKMEYPGVSPSMANSPNWEDMGRTPFQFSQPEPQQVFTPEPEQVFNIPGSKEATIVPTYDVPNVKALREREQELALGKSAGQMEIAKLNSARELFQTMYSQGMLDARSLRELNAQMDRLDKELAARKSIAAGNNTATVRAAEIRAAGSQRRNLTTFADSANYGVPAGVPLEQFAGQYVDKPLPEATKNTLDELSKIKEAAAKLLTIDEKIPGLFDSIFVPEFGEIKMRVDAFRGKLSDEQIEAQRLVNQIRTIIGHRNFGAALTPTELGQLRGFIVNLRMNPKQGRNNLRGLVEDTSRSVARLSTRARTIPPPQALQPVTLRDKKTGRTFRAIWDPAVNGYRELTGEEK